MTEDEALRIGREAVEDARKRVGDNKEELMREIEKRAYEDARLMTAFSLAGHLFLRSAQGPKH